MKIWISKYALTQGIFEVEATIHETKLGKMAVVKENLMTSHYHGEGRE